MTNVRSRSITGIVLVAAVVGCSGSTVPTDSALTENFNANRAEFLQLVKMLKDDRKIEHLWHSSATPKNAIEEKRWKEYRTLMSRAKVRGIHADWRNAGGVMFRSDMSDYSRYDRGYVWATKRPEPLYGSLDSQVKQIPPYAVYYKQIEDNWYLYLENKSD